MAILAAIIVFLMLCDGINVSVLTSDSTPTSLSQVLKLIDPRAELQTSLIYLSVTNIKNQVNAEDLKQFDLLFDATYSSILSASLLRFSEDFQIPLLCWNNCPATDSPVVFRIFLNCNEIAQVMKSTLNALNWVNYTVFYDSSECSTEVQQTIPGNKSIFIPDNVNEYLNTIISRFVKTSWIKTWVILTNANNSASIQASLVKNKMMKAGVGILGSPYSSPGLNYDYMLKLSVRRYQNANSTDHLIRLFILNTLREVAIRMNSGVVNLIDCLILVFPNNFFGQSLSLYNVKNSLNVEVSRISCMNGCLYTNASEITFIGGSKENPRNSNTTIITSLSSGPQDPNNSVIAANQIIMNGVYIAVEDINSSPTSIPGFTFSVLDIPCYTSTSKLNKTCYSNNSKNLGLYHISPHSEAYSVLLYDELQKYNITLFGTSDGSKMSSKPNYPYYISTGVPYDYEINSLLQMIKFMGYDSIALLTPNNTQVSWMNLVVKYAPVNKVNILNDLKNFTYSVNSTNNIIGTDDVFKKIIDSGARIVLTAAAPITLNELLAKFVDLGMEAGDMFFAVRSYNLSVLVNQSDPNYLKRKPLIAGMFSLTSSFFNGELGASILSRLKSRYGESNRRSCDNYDTYMLGAYAINSLILAGKDYEMRANINKEARAVKFVGCYGTIKAMDYTNLRECESYALIQIQTDGINFTAPVVAYNYPFGSTVFEIVKEIYWTPNGRPSTIRVNTWDCPYNPKYLSEFNDGKIVIIVVCTFISLFTIVNTTLLWKKYWNHEIDSMKEKVEMSFQDGMVMISVFAEMLQLASMGPDIKSLVVFLGTIANISSYGIDSFVNLKNGLFWYILISIFFCCGYWILLCIVWTFNLQERYNGSFIFRFFGWSILNLMPLIGNLLFIPIISTLINVFLCDESLDNTFSESILNHDCYQKCWGSPHLSYAITSGIFIICYQPLAVFFRPIWQEYLPMLHIKAVPKFLMFKSIFQVLLIVLNKTLKRYDAFAHSIVFLLLIFGYFIYLFKVNTFNYERLSMWQRLGVVGVFWLALQCTLFNHADHNSLIWILLLFIGWALIIIIGVAIQWKRYPSLLYRQKNKDIEKIFRWMFGMETQLEAFKSNNYAYNSKDIDSSNALGLSN